MSENHEFAGSLDSWRIADIARELASSRATPPTYSIHQADNGAVLLCEDGKPVVDLQVATIDELIDETGRWIVIDTESLRSSSAYYGILPADPWLARFKDCGIDV
ncbi:hypothetical protein [Pseudaeromonas pectinilytica]